jgi:hypothetical protein
MLSCNKWLHCVNAFHVSFCTASSISNSVSCTRAFTLRARCRSSTVLSISHDTGLPVSGNICQPSVGTASVPFRVTDCCQLPQRQSTMSADRIVVWRSCNPTRSDAVLLLPLPSSDGATSIINRGDSIQWCIVDRSTQNG